MDGVFGTDSYFDAKRFGGLEVDHQSEFVRLLDRQIGRAVAFENFVDNVAMTPAIARPKIGAPICS
jgi:hypothetical protein